ncbi:hypothetical protein BGX26_009455, partial [Mortierella sp. AD094]
RLSQLPLRLQEYVCRPHPPRMAQEPISYSGYVTNPTGPGLKRNKNLTQELIFHRENPDEYLYLQRYSRLKTLMVLPKLDGYDNGIYPGLKSDQKSLYKYPRHHNSSATLGYDVPSRDLDSDSTMF